MKRKRPFAWPLSLLILFLSLLLLSLSYLSPAAALLSLRVGQAIKAVQLLLFNYIPVFVAEILLILAPVFVFSIFFYLFRAKTRALLLIRVRTLFGFLLIFVSLYILTLGVGYSMKEEPEPVTVTASALLSLSDSIGEGMCLPTDDELPSPDEAASMIYSGYLSFADDRLAPTPIPPRPKSFILPHLASRLGIVAAYSFPSAEIAISQDAPIYIGYFSLAHEMAHLFGISDEGEANYYAYRALSATGNSALSFAADITALEYTVSSLSSLSPDLAEASLLALPAPILSVLSTHRRFYLKDSGRLSDISSSAQDKLLSVWDGGGSHAYSRFTLYLLSDYLKDGGI